MKSVMHNASTCYICKGNASEWHHIMNGAYRAKSEADGLVIRVCRKCHRYIHDHPATAKALKAEAERAWLEMHGTVENFIERYGKNYL